MSSYSDDTEAKYSAVRGVRRERQATRAKRNQPRQVPQIDGQPTARSTTRASRQKPRNIVVRAELRDEPDVRRIARAIIRQAVAEAEAAAALAAAQATTTNSNNPGTDDTSSEDRRV